MKQLMIGAALTALIGGGAFAQEPGEEIAVSGANAAVFATNTITTESKVTVTHTYSEAEDNGPAIVVENETKPAAVYVQSQTALQAVQQELLKRGISQNFDINKGSIVQIGTAQTVLIDPEVGDFLTERELLARQAELDARAKIAGMVRKEFSGSTRVHMYGTRERQEFEARFANEIRAAAEQRAKVEKLLQAIDRAEASKLAGVTTGDRFNKVVDGIIKKLDATYSSDVVLQDKQTRLDQLKSMYSEAKQLQVELDAKADSMYPLTEVETDANSLAEFKLVGSTVLFQSESWIGNKYQVALAVVWSPKLQERAVKALACGVVEGGTPGPMSLGEWLNSIRDQLPMMVGARQYIDNQGRHYFLGISSQELVDDIAQQEHDMLFARQMSDQAVAYSLFVEGQSDIQASAAMKKYKGNAPADVMKSLAADMKMETPKNLAISGLGQVYSDEGLHQLSGKHIYTSVSAVDGVLAANSDAIKQMWADTAIDVTRTSNEIRGRDAGRNEAYEEAKADPTDFNRGYDKGKADTERNVNAIRSSRNAVNVQPPPQARPRIVRPAPQPEKRVRVPGQQGVYTPNTGYTDDF